MCFRRLVALNQSRVRRCGHSRKSGLSLPIRRLDFWNATVLFHSLRYVRLQPHFIMKLAIHIALCQKLSGIFEARIYPVEYSTPNIMAASKDTRDSAWSAKVVDGIDLNKLQKVLDGVDYAAIRRRRNLYSRLYHEASISHQQGRGISFTDMLLLLAHHKLIVDRDALMCVTSILPMLHLTPNP
jgi:hypothetical protein